MNMETPLPVNLNALSAILQNAKKVMNKVEAANPIKSSSTTDEINESYGDYNSTSTYDERDEKEMTYAQTSTTYNNPTRLVDYSDEQVRNSNLPQAIKEAMIKNHIPKVSAIPTFNVEDIMGPQPKKEIKKEVIREVQQINNRLHELENDMVTISRGELKDLINETLLNFLKNSYEKTLTEETIKKTINVLIKEGKINGKK